MSIGRNGFSIKRMMAIMITLLLSLNVLGNLIPVQQVEAKTWTKSQIKKEITKTDAKIKFVKTKYNKAKKALAKAQKGTVSVFGATVVSDNPLVVYFEGVLGINRGYYWIESGTENFSTLFGTGTFKLTGKYRNYGDVTCAVAKGVKLPSDKVDKLGKKLDKLRSKKAALKHSLVNKATLYAENLYEDGERYLLAGKDYDIYDATDWTYVDENYSYTGYKSSDNSIASVNGRILTAKKSGTVTITVISSISKKKTKTKLVIKESGEIQKNDSSSSTEELENEVEQKNDSSSSTEELEDEDDEDEDDEDW